MRVSMLKTDPGYTPYGARLEIYLDGEKLARCVTADDATGEAWVYDTDAGGHLQRGLDGHAALKRLTGHVAIRPMPGRHLPVAPQRAGTAGLDPDTPPGQPGTGA